MSEKKFLKELEKTKLNNRFNEVQNLKMQLAEAALKKEFVIRQANSEFDNFLAKNEIDSKSAADRLQNYLADLNEIYGENTYRPSDGEIIPPPEKQKQKDAAK